MHRRAPALLAALALLLAGCGSEADLPANLKSADTHASAHAPAPSATVEPVKETPLRKGERFQEIRLPAKYTPKAPEGTGTDDYRCFLVDPGFDTDQLVSGVQVLLDNAPLVHHVVVSKVEPDRRHQGREDRRADPRRGLDLLRWRRHLGHRRRQPRQGRLGRRVGTRWGRAGHGRGHRHPAQGRLAARRPDALQPPRGHGADRSAVLLRLSEAKGSDKQALQTMLLPAPVELPCRDNRTKGMCSRALAVADLKKRFAEDPATADLLHLLCGPLKPGPVQSCTRPIREEVTIRAVSGHMHLLGRAITVDVNKGTPKAKRVLDIPVWNFDDQGSIPLETPSTSVPATRSR
jgi:hypothetical protein